MMLFWLCMGWDFGVDLLLFGTFTCIDEELSWLDNEGAATMGRKSWNIQCAIREASLPVFGQKGYVTRFQICN